jgi:hypothetical protein
VERVVGGDRAVDVPGGQRCGEGLVRCGHRVEVGGTEDRDGLASRQFVHRRGHGLGLDRGANVEGADRRRATGPHRYQTDLFEAGDRLADRGAGDAEPLAQLGVVEPLARLEGPVDDRRAQRPERLLAQRAAVGAGAAARDRHATDGIRYFTGREEPAPSSPHSVSPPSTATVAPVM